MVDSREWKVLLIDDEKDIQDVVAIALEDMGYEVVSANDGESGLRLCEKASPQIVITDVRMPKMDGIRVLELVKKMNPDIEVIVVTAFGEMDLAIQALQLDASDFITKPINDASLQLALERAKSRHTARKALKDYTTLLEKEKARTSRELIRSIDFQKKLIENAIDGIMGCDGSDLIVTFNRSLEQLLRIDREQVLNVWTWQQVFESAEAERLLKELSGPKYGGENRLFLYETAILDAEKKRVPVQLSSVRLADPKSGSGLVLFFRDLRKIRTLEREVEDQANILHQDKMIALGKLSASVVHEINNPLSGVLNYLRLMTRILRRGPLPEDRREKFMQYLDLVESETDRCSHIVSSLLDFSRKSPPSFGRVQIDELLERCVSLSRHKLELQRIELDLDLPTNLPAIEGDFNQLQQCVINLIFNAIDAMPEGGILTLKGYLEKSRNQVVISIGDTGHGISENDQPHIFEPFFTTKSEGYGVGLGLSTIYGIMQRHKGSVNVESQLSEGATFRLFLPLTGS